MPDIQLLHGNCLDILPTLPDCSVDSIVTDPPYELGFMGKKWDNSGIAYNPDLWQECLRVLKPGGHLLAFGGTRTYHRMAVAIEDAGFEIRDSLHWIYGSGFPKSLDVSKAIDKRGGAVAGFEKFRDAVKSAMQTNNVSRSTVQDALGNFMLSHYLTAGSQPAVPNWRDYQIIRDVVGLGNQYDDLFMPEAEREVIGSKDSTLLAVAPGQGLDRPPVELDITAPATDAAKEWSGWGTALKPAHEPIVVARKPLVGTVAGNVLQWGTGAINIDGTRVATSDKLQTLNGSFSFSGSGGANETGKKIEFRNSGLGRWPANIVFTHNHDCADVCTEGCPVRELNQQSGISKSTVGNPRGTAKKGLFANSEWNKVGREHNDAGGASRFFTVTEWDAPFRYVAKPGKRERNAGLDHLSKKVSNEKTPPGTLGSNSPRAGANRSGASQNHHPTVKPLALMRWLVRLVTPPGGTVLEPFAGSGTTLVACQMEGFNAIGIEMTDEYLPIIEGRLEWAKQQPPEPESDQQELPL